MCPSVRQDGSAVDNGICCRLHRLALFEESQVAPRCISDTIFALDRVRPHWEGKDVRSD